MSIYDNDYQYNNAPVMCPGKEITSMILGIHAVFLSVLTLLFGWVPYYGIIYIVIWGIFIIGCGIAAIVLYNKAKQQADYVTAKGKWGKNLSIISFVILALASIIGIIVQAAVIFVVVSSY